MPENAVYLKTNDEYILTRYRTTLIHSLHLKDDKSLGCVHYIEVSHSIMARLVSLHCRWSVKTNMVSLQSSRVL